MIFGVCVACGFTLWYLSGFRGDKHVYKCTQCNKTERIISLATVKKMLGMK